MRKLFSKKLWIILISCCLLGAGIVFACSGDFGDEYGTSNFTPEVFVDSSYSPFFYSQMFYYQIGHDESQNTRFNAANILEWSGYLNKGMIRDELDYLLLNASAGSIDSAAAYLSGKLSAVPSGMQAFTLLKDKKDKKVFAFFNYLRLAKKCEGFAVNVIHYAWEEDTTKKKIKFDASVLNRDLQDAFSKTDDIFLKERYWFQLERSYFFNTNPHEVINLFNATEKTMPRNTIYNRTLAYVAGAYYKLKDYSKANYYYSRVYDGCNELKTVAHYSFHPQEENDWKATLALCGSNDEKATLWQMLGIFYTDEKRAIREIYQLDPKSDKLDLLLARAINKYEQKFQVKDLAGWSSDMPNLDTSTNANKALHHLIINIAESGNTGKPWIWDMAAGYLDILDGKYDSANYFFAKAQKIIPSNKFAQAQFRLLKLINTIGEAKRIDDKLERKALPDIEWLRTYDEKQMPALRYRAAFEWMKHFLAKKYIKQHESEKAECFLTSSTFYADNVHVEAMKAFLSKPAKSPYEQLCANLSANKMEDLFQYQAIQSAYKGNIDTAIEQMGKAGEAAAGILPGNPFNGRINDCHDCDHEAAQKIKYTRMSFLKKLKEIKDKIAAGEEVYTNALLLGNAYYNISQYGNARFFYEGKILGESHSTPYYIDTAFRKMLTSMNLASQYYQLALSSAKTDEQKAKCQYMIAKCERNQWYNKYVYNKAEDDYGEDKIVDFYTLTGFKALKQYANTNYYKDVIKECGYFRSYIKK